MATKDDVAELRRELKGDIAAVQSQVNSIEQQLRETRIGVRLGSLEEKVFGAARRWVLGAQPPSSNASTINQIAKCTPSSRPRTASIGSSAKPRLAHASNMHSQFLCSPLADSCLNACPSSQRTGVLHVS